MLIYVICLIAVSYTHLRPKNDDYAIIGGHVADMETSMETLKREFEEELHAEIEVDNLLAIGCLLYTSISNLLQIVVTMHLRCCRRYIGLQINTAMYILLLHVELLIVLRL